GLPSGVELLELRPGAAQPDLTCRTLDEVERDEPAGASPVPWLDHQAGDFPSDGTGDHAAYLADCPVAATGLSPDRELRNTCHSCPLPLARAMSRAGRTSHAGGDHWSLARRCRRVRLSMNAP